MTSTIYFSFIFWNFFKKRLSILFIENTKKHKKHPIIIDFSFIFTKNVGKWVENQ